MSALDIEFVKALAREAGDRALTMLSAMQPEYKADGSYVTHIDRQTEELIRERIAERYPDHSFQGEEYGRFGDPSRPLWCVDPIDGTTNMVYGLTHWCVSIGLIEGGEAAGGAVYIPNTNEMYWAVRGEGAYCNGVRLAPPDRTAIHGEDTLGMTSSSVKTLNPWVLEGRIRCIGSIAIEFVYTAHGRLCSHVGCHEGINDLAASLCICTEAGCVVEYLDGSEFSIQDMVARGKTRGHFVVAPPEFARVLRSRLKVTQTGSAA
ncbi:MAG TPA: inositol monophosphatase family protein [Chthonomonadaceae bacterium]|nr:inositol monophosphatase family protein [Chthonomonadaceae bacterium]